MNTFLPIATSRLTLTPLTAADFVDLTALYTDKEVRRYLGGVLSAESALSALEVATTAENSRAFTVKLGTNNEVLGVIFIAPHHNLVDTEISFVFLRQHWGNGYARESICAALGYCKDELQLARVVSETQKANARSCRLLEKIGFVAQRELERFGAMQRLYVHEFYQG